MMNMFYQKTVLPNTIGTVVGIGQPDYQGDEGAAVQACLNEPKSLAIDSENNLYIADSENHVVRKVDGETGIITTIAGRHCETEGPNSPEEGVLPEASADIEEDPFADPPDSTEGKYVQVTDLSGTVRFVVGSALKAQGEQGDGGAARHASLNFPSAIAVGGEDLYIADTMNHQVRHVDMQTGTIRTIAGTGQHRFSGEGGPSSAAMLNEPCAVVLDGKGNLFVADQSNNRIRKIDLTTEIITTVAGTGESAYSGDGGQGVETCLAGPSGLAMGPDGALYIADTFNSRIRRLDLDTGVITTVVGDGGSYRFTGLSEEVSMSISRPYGLALDSHGHIVFTDSDSHVIRRWDCQKKTISVLAGNGQAGFSGDGGATTESGLSFPFGVALDRMGNIFVADTFNHRIRMIAVAS